MVLEWVEQFQSYHLHLTETLIGQKITDFTFQARSLLARQFTFTINFSADNLQTLKIKTISRTLYMLVQFPSFLPLLITRSQPGSGKAAEPSQGRSTCLVYASVNSKPDHPPRATPGDSHILVAPGVGFSLLCFAWGSAQGFAWVLNQSNFEKSAIFASAVS